MILRRKLPTYAIVPKIQVPVYAVDKVRSKTVYEEGNNVGIHDELEILRGDESCKEEDDEFSQIREEGEISAV